MPFANIADQIGELMDKKMLFYNGFADVFDQQMNLYDVEKRLRVIYKEFLDGQNLAGKLLLDAGCGTGKFSLAATDRGASVYSLDIGQRLLKKTHEKCSSVLIAADVQQIPFADESFDFVVSSEVIEHVIEPEKAIHEMCRVLKRGGYLALTTPNKRWHFAVRIANALKLRPYKGYENWISWGALRQIIREEGMEILLQRGFHLFPFLHKSVYGILDRADALGYKPIGRWMINVGVLARKP